MSESWSKAQAREYFKTGKVPVRKRTPAKNPAPVKKAANMPLIGASEHQEQVAFFQWVKIMTSSMPELGLMYAIPNGGHRHQTVAAKLKGEGVQPGVPDIHLPVARGGFHGLWIEMKAGRNTTSLYQDEFIENLREQGHRVEVCYGAQAALEVVLEYLTE